MPCYGSETRYYNGDVQQKVGKVRHFTGNALRDDGEMLYFAPSGLTL
jgi:hypothetical protein